MGLNACRVVHGPSNSEDGRRKTEDGSQNTVVGRAVNDTIRRALKYPSVRPSANRPADGKAGRISVHILNTLSLLTPLLLAFSARPAPAQPPAAPSSVSVVVSP